MTVAFPYFDELECPWCERIIERPQFTRMHDNGVEFRCPSCGKTHVRKEGSADAFAFFPGDIYAVVDDDEEPWNLGGIQG
jgi:hypothetical protein